MKIFTIWFEIFGKKMKTELYAESEVDAETKLLGKLKINKIESQEFPTEDSVEFLKGIFGFK